MKTREIILGYINMQKDKDGKFTVNQHEVANAFNLNSGHISQVLSELIKQGKIVKLSPASAGKPAVYKVVA